MLADKLLLFVTILLVGEVLAVLTYRYLLNPPFDIKQSTAAIVEGAVERFFLFLSFVNGIYLALVFFGALKIATHINPNDNPPEEGISLPKMYYLIGNLLSASFAVIYDMLWRYFMGVSS